MHTHKNNPCRKTNVIIYDLSVLKLERSDSIPCKKIKNKQCREESVIVHTQSHQRESVSNSIIPYRKDTSQPPKKQCKYKRRRGSFIRIITLSLFSCRKSRVDRGITSAREKEAKRRVLLSDYGDTHSKNLYIGAQTHASTAKRVSRFSSSSSSRETLYISIFSLSIPGVHSSSFAERLSPQLKIQGMYYRHCYQSNFPEHVRAAARKREKKR